MIELGGRFAAACLTRIVRFRLRCVLLSSLIAVGFGLIITGRHIRILW